LSDIEIVGSEVSLGLLRLFLIFGFVTLVRLMAMKWCFSKKELFYGSLAELKSYLDYCGKAEATTLRKVIALPEEEIITVKSKHRPPAAPDPSEQGREVVEVR